MQQSRVRLLHQVVTDLQQEAPRSQLEGGGHSTLVCVCAAGTAANHGFRASMCVHAVAVLVAAHRLDVEGWEVGVYGGCGWCVLCVSG